MDADVIAIWLMFDAFQTLAKKSCNEVKNGMQGAKCLWRFYFWKKNQVTEKYLRISVHGVWTFHRIQNVAIIS